MRTELINSKKYEITDYELSRALENYEKSNKLVAKTVIRENINKDKLSIDVIELIYSDKIKSARTLQIKKVFKKQIYKKYHKNSIKWFFSMEDINNALSKTLKKVGDK